MCKGIRIIRQKGKHDCGIASAAMLARTTMKEARNAFADINNVEKNGADDAEMRYALRRLGYGLGNKRQLTGSAPEKELALWQCRRDCLVDYERHWLVWDMRKGRLISPDEYEPKWRRVVSFRTISEL